MIRHAIALGFVATISACAKPADPAWALPPSAAILGDTTVAGAPAAIARFAHAPVLDGKLDDDVWSSAVALGPFVDPGDGHAAPADHPVAGFARAGWDDTHLYLGFVVRDGKPATPFARDESDPHLWSKSSAVEVMLQPGDPGDNREYFEFQVDTAGAVFDSRWDDYNTPITGTTAADRVFGHPDWSAHAERAAFVEKGRFYSIEVALPWSSFTSSRAAIPPHPGDTWRLDLYSFRDGQRLALAWSPLKRQGNFHKSSRFGRVRFQ